MRILLIGLCLFLNCSSEQGKKAAPAFYHWQQDLALNSFEKEVLATLDIKRLYVRFFDVDWQNDRAIPISILDNQGALPDSVEVVPVVFITNRTILNSGEEEIKLLANRIIKKVNELVTSFEMKVSEVQIDCDWSGNSRQKYFQLLDFLKEGFAERGRNLSATIRLHQIKYYQKTGVPNVDRGVLMFYNTEAVDDPTTVNSILDLTVAKEYFHQFDTYPLTLDIALPVFRWGVVFQRDRFVRLINGLDRSILADTSEFLKLDENQFELRKSMYLEGYYLYKGDRIRTESISEELLMESAQLLAKELSKEDRHIIFYHLDSSLIANYSNEVLETVYRTFD